MMFPRLSIGAVFVYSILALVERAQSVPVAPFPIQLQNDDGTFVMGTLMGDEVLSWAEDLEGFALLKDATDGSWHYAMLDEQGRLVSTTVRAGSLDPGLLNLPLHARPGLEQIQRAREQKAAAQPLLPPPAWNGDIPNLVLLVRFANQTTRFGKEDFDQVFNGSTGSVQDYYLENSYGQWRIVSTVTDWLDLSQNDEYYATNAESPYGHPEEMIREAVGILDGQGFDFTKFDSNQDRIIDAVDVIHSGLGYEATSNKKYIHSHYRDLRWTGDDFYTHDNIRIVAYHTEPELRDDQRSICGIGKICHETGHFFGLPDLYDYGYDSSGLGMWCLMAAGSWGGPPGPEGQTTVPTQLSVWPKVKLGFVAAQKISASFCGRQLAAIEADARAVRLDVGMPTSQYFLLENRQQVGYDAYLPGNGLLIYHVDESRHNNDDQNHYMVDLEQADGRRDLNQNPYNVGDEDDPFPTNSNDSFTPNSNPNSKGYGQTSSQVSVLNISRNQDALAFDVVLSGQTCPVLDVEPRGFTLEVNEGEEVPVQTLSVSNKGGGTLNWTVSVDGSWLDASPRFGTAPTQVSVAVQAQALLAGSYRGAIILSGSDVSPVRIAVTLEVRSLLPSAPSLARPSNLSEVDTSDVVLKVANARDPQGKSLTYRFEVYEVGSTIPSAVLTAVAEGQSGVTSVTVSPRLARSRAYEWRARAVNSDNVAGPWSERWVFSLLEGEAGGCAVVGSFASSNLAPVLLMLVAWYFQARRSRKRHHSL